MKRSLTVAAGLVLALSALPVAANTNVDELAPSAIRTPTVVAATTSVFVDAPNVSFVADVVAAIVSVEADEP